MTRSWPSPTPMRSARRFRTCSQPAPMSCSSTSRGWKLEPEQARRFAVPTLERALDGVSGTTALHICFGYPAFVPNRPPAYHFLTELAATPIDQVSIETAQPDLDLSVLEELPSKTIILGVIALDSPEVEDPETVAGRLRRALPLQAAFRARRRPRLRDEVPAPRGGVREARGTRGRRPGGRGAGDRSESMTTALPPAISATALERALDDFRRVVGADHVLTAEEQTASSGTRSGTAIGTTTRRRPSCSRRRSRRSRRSSARQRARRAALDDLDRAQQRLRRLLAPSPRLGRREPAADEPRARDQRGARLRGRRAGRPLVRPLRGDPAQAGTG